ncbi:MAG: hypothetical protein HQK53_05680 [Oligoflexia bacterium]|nr:hypothetical protein [Oligoflexia bacterium]
MLNPKFKMIILTILKLSVLATFCSCASSKFAAVQYNVPPELALTKYKTISVEPLVGDVNDEFANALVQELMQADSEKKFQILYRNNIAPIVREEVLSPTAKTKSKLKTADLLVVGSVASDVNFIPADPRFSSSGDKKYGVSTANIKFVDGHTSEIIFSKEFSERSSYYGSIYERSILTPTTPRTMISESQRVVIRKILAVLFPSKRVAVFALYSNNSVPEIDLGHEFFDQDKFNEALQKYQQAIKNPSISSDDKGNVLMAMAFLKLNGTPDFNEAIRLAREAQKHSSNSKFEGQISKIIAVKENPSNPPNATF